VLATLAFAKTLPYVDASRWIVAGQSVGGVTTVATTWRHPDGLVGAINFAGGTGGDPEHSPGRPASTAHRRDCGARRPRRRRAQTLWLYWENDEYLGPRETEALGTTPALAAASSTSSRPRKTGHGECSDRRRCRRRS